MAYNPWKELLRTVRPIFTVCHACPCALCGFLFLISYPLPRLLRSLQTRQLVCSLKLLIASTECKSKAIKIMPELGCKVSALWICPQGKHLPIFSLAGILFFCLFALMLKPLTLLSWSRHDFTENITCVLVRAFLCTARIVSLHTTQPLTERLSQAPDYIFMFLWHQSHLNNGYIIHFVSTLATCLSSSLVIYNQDIKEADIFWNKSNKCTDLIFCLTHAALSTERMMSCFCQCGLMVTHLSRGFVPVTGGTFVTSAFCL